jgi:hypothetical protein
MKSKFGGLNRNTLRIARYKHDIDYVRTLGKEEKLWLSQFCDEYYNATFKESPLHNSQELKKACYDQYNEATRDAVNHSSTMPEPYKQRKANKYSPNDYDLTKSYSKDENLMIYLAERIDSFNQAISRTPKKERPSMSEQKEELLAIRAIVETAIAVFDAGAYPGSTAAALQQTRVWLVNMLSQLEAGE